MKKLSYDSLNAGERQYFDDELKRFTEYNSDEYSYVDHIHVKEIYKDAIDNNRLVSVVLLLEIYKLEKPDNYFTETGYELHSSLFLLVEKLDKELGEEICSWMMDYLFQQTPHMIGDVVFMSGHGLENKFLDRFYEGFESLDEKIKKKAEIALKDEYVVLER